MVITLQYYIDHDIVASIAYSNSSLHEKVQIIKGPDV